MLHTINKSPYSHRCLAECLRACSADDAILLIEDGVYAALADSDSVESLLTKTSAVYALQPDIAARGLTDRIASEIKAIDYDGFVQLCIDQPKMMAWY
jgi:tRNA 2-thiouridine synthesizing protein B